VQIIDQQQAQSDVSHGGMNFGPEPGRRRTGARFPSQRGEDGSQQLRNAGPIRCLDQRRLDAASLGVGIFSGGMTRQKAPDDRRLAVVGRPKGILPNITTPRGGSFIGITLDTVRAWRS
jgi:hypothetical protein